MSNSVNISQLFSSFEKDKINPLPEGEYDLEVATAKGKGGNTVVATYTVLTGPYVGHKALIGQFSFGSETAASIAFQNLEGFGLDKAYFQQDPSVDDIARALLGRRVHAFVQLREFNNQPRNQFAIGAVKLLGAAPPTSIGAIPALAPAVTAAPPVPVVPVAAPASVVPVPVVPVAAPVPVVPVPVVPVAAPASVVPVAAPAPVVPVAAPASVVPEEAVAPTAPEPAF